jgi:hypothetical protein
VKIEVSWLLVGYRWREKINDKGPESTCKRGKVRYKVLSNVRVIIISSIISPLWLATLKSVYLPCLTYHPHYHYYLFITCEPVYGSKLFEDHDLLLVPPTDLRLDLDPLVGRHPSSLVAIVYIVNALVLQNVSILRVHWFLVNTCSTILIRFNISILQILQYIQ